jgi:decaprenylphospho-beta-D-erythro-pentofuranosid-2-ulose 2-reductase
MTKHISGKGFLWSTPARIATIVLRAMDRKQGVVYAPGFWRPIMLAIRSLPDRVFRRLSIEV